jgi:hypothetical protein
MMQKIAVVSGGSPDYLVDIVADGLIRLLGRDKVHLRFNQFAPWPGFAQTLHGFESDASTIDECGVLIASVRSDLDALLKSRAGKLVAVIDGEDDAHLRSKWIEFSDLYFKRECLRGESLPPKVRSLSFAAVPEEIERAKDRDVEVFFASGDSHEDRKTVRRILSQEKMWNTSVGHLYEYTHEAYMTMLGRSRIGVNVRGAGWDTYRYWEIAWSGALLLSQRLGIQIDDDFVPNVEAVYFNGAEDCVRIAKTLLTDEARRTDIAARGLEAVRTRHLSTHRATKVLDMLSSVRSGT